MKYLLCLALVASGVYTLHWLKNAEVGAALMVVGAVLFDPADVTAAVKAWRAK